jgi:hypothetical protein
VYLDTENILNTIIEFTEELKRGSRKTLNF